MQIGDLVKVYNFSHRAREHYKADARSTPDDIDGHNVGLIIPGLVNGPHLKVLRTCDGEAEFYNIDRMEVISEGR